MDLQFLAGAFSPLVRASHEAVISAARESIVGRAVALAKGQFDEEPDPFKSHLDAWIAATEVTAAHRS